MNNKDLLNIVASYLDLDNFINFKNYYENEYNDQLYTVCYEHISRGFNYYIIFYKIFINNMTKHIYSMSIDYKEYEINDHNLKCFIKLDYLRITRNHNITDEGVKNLINITNLDIEDSIITDKGIKNLINITNLHINKFITYKGIKQLPKLKILNIGMESYITNEQLNKLTNLNELNFCTNYDITDEGIKDLINLKILIVNDNITDEGIKNLINITDITINFNITFEALIKLPNLKHIRIITEYPGFTEEQYEILNKKKIYLY